MITTADHPPPRTRLWLLVFVASMVTSVLAVFLKPRDYSFYMFLPATPGTAVERCRLGVANVLLVTALLLSLIASYRQTCRSAASRRWPYLILLVLVVVHPLLQPIFLENLDTYLNYRWYRNAMAAHIVGKSDTEVHALLGAPTRIMPYENGVLWEYQPLRFYWLGSCGQVFFNNGRVTSIDPNDD